MSLADDIRDDFLSLWEELECCVVIGEVILKALVSNVDSSLELDLGGFELSHDLSVRILRADLTLFPKIGATIIFDAQQYRIASIAGKQNFPILTLQCQAK